MKAYLSAFPAYGRSYDSQESLREAFLSGLDFSASYRGGPYFSIRDFTDNDNLKDFGFVILVQPAGTRGTLYAAVISRREMCERKEQERIKQSTTESVVSSSEMAAKSPEMETFKSSIQSDERAGTCELERLSDE